MDLSQYQSDYRTKRDIEIAIAFSSVRTFLTNLDHGEDFTRIQSIRMTPDTITITLLDPLFRSWLESKKKALLEHLNGNLTNLRLPVRKELRFR